MSRKEKQELKLAVFAGFPPIEGPDGKPETMATPVGHIPPVTLVVEDVTMFLTSTDAVKIANSLLMAAHKVQAESMLAGFMATLVDRRGRRVFGSKSVHEAYSAWLRDIDQAQDPVVDGNVDRVESGYEYHSSNARHKVIKTLMKGGTASIRDAENEAERDVDGEGGADGDGGK